MIVSVHTVRRLAADILGVGENRIRIASTNMKEVLSAMRRSDVRALIDKGIVKAAPVKGRRKKKGKKRKSEGRRRGKSSIHTKKEWMKKVRAQRKLLKSLVSLGAVKRENKRAIYMKIKSGIFKNKRAMLTYLKDNGIIPQDFELPKEEAAEEKKEDKEKGKGEIVGETK